MFRDQVKVFARGRGEMWYYFLRRFGSGSTVQIILGRSSMSFQAGGRWWTEPHNQLLLLLYCFGLVGTGLLTALYIAAWMLVRRILAGQPGAALYASACFLIPVWHGFIAEPLRYPTFFTMLFVSVAMVACEFTETPSDSRR